MERDCRRDCYIKVNNLVQFLLRDFSFWMSTFVAFGQQMALSLLYYLEVNRHSDESKEIYTDELKKQNNSYKTRRSTGMALF